MPNDLSTTSEYRETIQRLEEAKHLSAEGGEFWLAREIHAVLGYQTWDKFEPVVDRAAAALHANGIDPSHHIAQTSKMMEVGGGALREGVDYFLSRAACRLIAMNGDPTKPQIAASQAYFLVQTHRMEIEEQRADDEKRLELREKVAQSHRLVSGVAQEAGVSSRMQGVFHDARYQGLYGMSLKEVKVRKGLSEKEQLYDRAGAMELSANDFQMNLAAEVIQKEGIKGEARTIQRNKAVAADVRRVMREQGATLPENLPLVEPIAAVRKREKARKKIAKPNTTSGGPQLPS